MDIKETNVMGAQKKEWLSRLEPDGEDFVKGAESDSNHSFIQPSLLNIYWAKHGVINKGRKDEQHVVSIVKDSYFARQSLIHP